MEAYSIGLAFSSTIIPTIVPEVEDCPGMGGRCISGCEYANVITNKNRRQLAKRKSCFIMDALILGIIYLKNKQHRLSLLEKV